MAKGKVTKVVKENMVKKTGKISITCTIHTTTNLPAKLLEKWLNTFDAEYFDACGDESYGQWLGDNNKRWNDEWSSGNGVHLMMMLEKEQRQTTTLEKRQRLLASGIQSWEPNGESPLRY